MSKEVKTDDELRLIDDVLNQSNLSAFAKEGIMKLILADRKKHELQAKIDTLKRLPTVRTNLNGSSIDDVVLRREIERRIAELKQELEKL